MTGVFKKVYKKETKVLALRIREEHKMEMADRQKATVFSVKEDIKKCRDFVADILVLLGKFRS